MMQYFRIIGIANGQFGREALRLETVWNIKPKLQVTRTSDGWVGGASGRLGSADIVHTPFIPLECKVRHAR